MAAEVVQKIIDVKLEASAAIGGIVKLNDAIAANNKAMAENTAMMQQEGANIEQLKRANEELAVKTKQLKEEKRVLQKEVQNELRQQVAQKGSLKDLRAHLSNLTKQYDSLSKAERENINVGGKLKNTINQVTNEIKAAEEGTQRYYRNVGNYQNAIMEAIGLNGRFGSSVAGIINMEGGFKGAMAAMGTSAKAFGKALTGLLANPVFAAVAGIVGAGMAFKWFYDYNVGVEEALRLTREFTGESGKDLQNLRAEIAATASTYGKEYMDVLRSVDALTSHYHMSAGEAIKTINDGFQAGADLNGDYLQKLQQYAPLFHDAGIEASRLAGILTQTRSGIWSDQGLEAIKQGSARIREMSKTTMDALRGIGINADEMERKLKGGTLSTFDALRQVSAQLKAMPDNAREVGEVMSTVFGRQGKFASQEMIEQLATMITDVEELKKVTGEHGEALEANRQATAELEKATATLFSTGEAGWEDMKTNADTYAKKALTAVVNKIAVIRDQFMRMYRESGVFRTIVRLVAGAIGWFGNLFTGVFRHIHAGFTAAATWVVAFLNVFKQAFTAIGEMARGVGDILTGDIDEGVARISSGLRKGVTESIKGINGALAETGNFVHGITDGFTESYNAVDNLLGDAKELKSTLSSTPTTTTTEDGSGGGGGNDTTTGGNKGHGGNKGRGGNAKETPAQKAEREAREAHEKRINDLIKRSEELRRQAMEEEAKASVEGINRLYDAQRAAFVKAYGEREKYEGDALEGYDASLKDIEAKRTAAIAAFNAKQAKEQAENAKALRDDARRLAQAMMEGQEDGSAQQTQWRLQLLRLQLEEELRALDENERMKTENLEVWEQMRNAVVEKYAKQETQIKKEQADRQREIELGKVAAAGQAVGAMGDVLEAMGEKNKAALTIAKMLGLAEVMINQGVAISNAVKAGSNAVTPWQMIAQIAASVAAVMGAMMQATKAIKSAKFATGGYVSGAGTGTSDSIPVRVSNGESVINANSTAMFSGLLSALNQLGGGVPIQVTQTAAGVQGEEMLARAVARGVAMLPAPVVSVQDINRGQRQVAVLNERATL